MRRNKINDRKNPFRKRGVFDFGGKLMFYLKSMIGFKRMRQKIKSSKIKEQMDF